MKRSSSGLRVLVTGSASHLAQALLPRLCNQPGIERVTAVDLRPTAFTHPRLATHLLDLTVADPARWLTDHDALVHLAWVVLRGHMPLARMRAVNVTASQRWLGAAAETGLARIVHLSSASVYGHGQHLAENAPLSPLPGFHYACHKAELERWLDAQQLTMVRLRPHIILGPHAQPLLRAILHLPFWPAFPDPQPQLQCVHENDVAEAILLTLLQTEEGPFNLAAPGSFSLRDAIRAHNPFAFGIPPRLAAMFQRWIWRLTSAGGEPGWVHGAGHSLTLDCSRAQTRLGWQAKVPLATMTGTIAG